MFRNIMLLSDLTDITRLAFPVLDRLADRDTRVVLYHAHAGASERFYLADSIRAVINDATRKRVLAGLALFREELESRGLQVDMIAGIGSAYDLLPETIERLGIDLVVIPTRSQHSLIRPISNSVTARAIRSHQVPVVTVSDNASALASGWSGLGKILHPVTFGANHRHGIAAAESLASLLGSELHLVHCVRSLELDDFYAEFPDELGMSFQQDDILESARKRLEDRLTEVTSVTGHADVIEAENVGRGLCQYASEGGFGAIVLPAVGADRIRSQLLGSVAEHVIRNATCPVFVLDRPLGPTADATDSSGASAATVEGAIPS